MERVQLAETLIPNAAIFGLSAKAGTEFAADSAEVIDQALIDATEHLATTNDDVAYVIIRVEANPADPREE